MNIKYKIDNIDLNAQELLISCFCSGCPESVQFSLKMAMENGKYPEGSALDRVIEAHIPHGKLEATVRKKEGSKAPTWIKDDPLGSLGQEQSRTTIPFITEGKEKIFLSKPLHRMNVLMLPIEVY